MEVDVFIPCFIDQFFPETAKNFISLLKKAGCTVFYNENQTCCGQLAFNAGFWDEAKKVGEKFIADFSNDRYVVAPSCSCTGMVRENYKELFHNTAFHLEYKKLKENMYEVSDFLVNIVRKTDFGAEFSHVVTYHDSCSSLREYKLGNEPRLLLSKVKGLELVEMKSNDECCGFGGTFSVKHPAISTAMAEQKIENALETGAEYIVSTDSSCLMHLDAYIQKNELPIKTIHLVDVLSHFN